MYKLHENWQVNNMETYDRMIAGIHRLSGDDSITNEIAERCVPQMEATDGIGKDYETLKELALWLLGEGDALNVYHWNVDSNTKHELLAEAYELCRGTGDKLAETYIAKTGREMPGNITVKVSDRRPSDEKIVSILRNLGDKMNGAVVKNPKFSEGVKNIFADFDESITTIIYKYSRFKA